MTTLPRFVMFLLAFSLAIFILCWADIALLFCLFELSDLYYQLMEWFLAIKMLVAWSLANSTFWFWCLKNNQSQLNMKLIVFLPHKATDRQHRWSSVYMQYKGESRKPWTWDDSAFKHTHAVNANYNRTNVTFEYSKYILRNIWNG